MVRAESVSTEEGGRPASFSSFVVDEDDWVPTSRNEKVVVGKFFFF